MCLLVLLMGPTGGWRRGKLILIDGTNQTVETAHNIINARYHYSISGILQEHLKWPFCNKKTTKKTTIIVFFCRSNKSCHLLNVKSRRDQTNKQFC